MDRTTARSWPHSKTFETWTRLALAAATAYIVISHIFKPLENDCKMTFMMEPPKFIPLQVDSNWPHNPSGPPGEHHQTDNYTLFMYSEFGFPLTSDLHRDLKDSMPVLFVPGNAGSYQQVRSLASTSIRRQLQSLDAFKFAFYTIDFKEELSGFSGALIAKQIEFVRRATQQILAMHPSETGGVILVGHSVGGFITKALFATPDFDSNTIPLLINLASPLTKPYVAFDSKTVDLYRKTNNYWSINHLNLRTISVSISSGHTDRLVPKHLSLDNYYDLSLATNSIRDVWMTTDHVSITWCRELMQKLSRLLSALMDKKKTQLIEDKSKGLLIVHNELLTNEIGSQTYERSMPRRESRISKSSPIKTFSGYFAATRAELLDVVLVLDLSNSINSQNILILIEHIDSIRENAVYGCRSLNSSDKSVSCLDRVDLLPLVRRLPSRRIEPKKSSITLSKFDGFGCLVFDFTKATDKYANNKLPEQVSVQTIDLSKFEGSLFLPTLIEYLIKRILMQSFSFKLETRARHPAAFMRYRLENLRHPMQYFVADLRSQGCGADSGATLGPVMLFQDGRLVETFHQSQSNSLVTLQISSTQSILSRTADQKVQRAHLELFIDGTCENRIELRLDLWALMMSVVNTKLFNIVVCASYFAYAKALSSQLQQNAHKPDQSLRIFGWSIWLLGFLLGHLACSAVDNNFGETAGLVEGLHQISWTNEVVVLLCVFLASNGVHVLAEYVTRRVVDLAIIMNNLQAVIRDRLSPSSSGEGPEQKSNGSAPELAGRPTGASYEWPLVVLVLSLGVTLSRVYISAGIIFMIIRQQLALNEVLGQLKGQQSLKLKDLQLLHRLELSRDVLLGLASFASLALLSNLPDVLLNADASIMTSLDMTSPKSKVIPLALAFCLAKIKFGRLEKAARSRSLGCEERVAPRLLLGLQMLIPLLTIVISSNMCTISSINSLAVILLVEL